MFFALAAIVLVGVVFNACSGSKAEEMTSSEKSPIVEQSPVVSEIPDELEEIPSPKFLTNLLQKAKDSRDFEVQLRGVVESSYMIFFNEDLSLVMFCKGSVESREIPTKVFRILGFQKEFFADSFVVISYDTLVQYVLTEGRVFKSKSDLEKTVGNIIFLKEGKDTLSSEIWGQAAFEQVAVLGGLKDSFGILKDSMTVTFSLMSNVSRDVGLSFRDVKFLFGCMARDLDWKENPRYGVELSFWNSRGMYPGAHTSIQLMIASIAEYCKRKSEIKPPGKWDNYNQYDEWLAEELPNDDWCMGAIGKLYAPSVVEVKKNFYGQLQKQIIQPLVL